ncbi:hypothetical protein E2R51_14290 [Jeotgalibacillus sp. S-D1]|uniref:hypothetical protein n=1 Tax=Jeotgalibacillus sp. S-D1 TaxID=2552189 RepID=UPI00105981F6|nr:hypothetical protein [Jeotgalibacillus sp. S-D1]TDL31527.1 hypothetical protein E2R51_14290 [Jeotgalibacillus sp. S-D1]
MDQLLRIVSIISMILFGTIELFYGLNFGEWSLKALIGFGAALALFLLTLQSSSNDDHYTQMKH